MSWKLKQDICTFDTLVSYQMKPVCIDWKLPSLQETQTKQDYIAYIKDLWRHMMDSFNVQKSTTALLWFEHGFKLRAWSKYVRGREGSAGLAEARWVDVSHSGAGPNPERRWSTQEAVPNVLPLHWDCCFLARSQRDPSLGLAGQSVHIPAWMNLNPNRIRFHVLNEQGRKNMMLNLKKCGNTSFSWTWRS